MSQPPHPALATVVVLSGLACMAFWYVESLLTRPVVTVIGTILAFAVCRDCENRP
jgi:hypothetical protein